MIPLVKNSIDSDDISSLIDWLKTDPRLTKGELTIQYEKDWSEFLGLKYGVAVNSGSSANLIMLSTLIQMGLLSAGDKVVVPSLSWSTDLAPVVQLGLEPVLCDCNLNDLSIDIDHFSELIKTENIKAIILVSVLGLVPQMDIIKTICDDNDIILLEDVCESFGSEYKGKKLGTYGLMSTYSTYFGHHLSTIEGGMVCTNDSSVYNVMKSLRSHGWDRDMDEDYQKIHREEFGVTDDFDSLYKFYYFGYNFRSTDLQAFLGIRQLNKAKDIIYLRNRNYESYKNRISDDLWKPKVTSDSFVSNFAYPIIHKDRDLIVSNLQDMNVEVRPLICGSLGRQPFWIKKYGISKLPNVDYVDRCGLYLPNNHQLIESEIEIICDIINGR